MTVARTASYSFGNNVVLPAAGNVLVPDRQFGRKGIWVKNQGTNPMSITEPSGAIYKLDAGATWMPGYTLIEDGQYLITGTAADTFSFKEVF